MVGCLELFFMSNESYANSGMIYSCVLYSYL